MGTSHYRQLVLLTVAIGTEAFDDVIHRQGLKALGKHHAGDMHLFETEGAMTLLTAEMHVQVVMGSTAVAAEFILDTLASIFNDVH